MIRPPRIATLHLLAALAAATPMHAQDLRGSLDAGVSHARPPAGVEADAASYLLGGGRLSAGPFSAGLYGGLSANENAGSWITGDLGMRSGRALAPWLYGALALRGAAFAVGGPTSYSALLGRATPELRASRGPAHAVVRVHGGVGTSEVADTRSDLWIYGGGGEIGYAFPGLSAAVGGDLYEAPNGAYAAAYISAGGPTRDFDWYGELRVWDVPAGDPELEVVLAVSVPIDPDWSVHITGARTGPDPLLGTPAGVSAGALVSRRFEHTRVPLARIESGTVVLRLRGIEADRIEVTGDFTGWRPVPLSREGGEWRVRIDVTPGLYHYGFLVDGEWYIPEEAPGQVSDEFGRRNATLVVTPPGDPEAP